MAYQKLDEGVLDNDSSADIKECSYMSNLFTQGKVGLFSFNTVTITLNQWGTNLENLNKEHGVSRTSLTSSLNSLNSGRWFSEFLCII